jgi:cation-transporting P-type ATPase 13A2
MITYNQHDLSVPFNHFNRNKYSIAISGDVFRWLVDFGDAEVLNKVGQLFFCFK